MNWFMAGVLCATVVEAAVRLPFARLLRRTVRTASGALWVLRAHRVSDHWKEQVMVAYSGRMFACSFKLLGLLLLLAAAIVLLVLAFGLVAPGFPSFIAGWWGILASLVFASLYLSVRKHLPHASIRPARQDSA